MGKDTISGGDSRTAILRGVNSLAETVKITFGPQGRTVLLGKNSGSPVFTRDGFTVANAIELPDRFENMGAQMVVEVASKTADTVGDGTTTATLLAQAIFRDGVRLVAAGADPLALKRGIEKAVDVVVGRLEKDADPFSAGISDAVKLAALPSLTQILEEENLSPETIQRFLKENAELKETRDIPVVSRLLLAALATGIESNVANRIASKVLKAQRRLSVTFGKIDDQIKKLAANSASNDDEIGSRIAEAIRIVGNDGVIIVEESKTLETSLEFVEGMRFDRGYVSPYFVTEAERMEAILDNPFILIHEKRIASVNELVPLLERVAKTGRPLLVIAEDFEGEALSTLVLNKLRGTLFGAGVKAPGFGDHRKAMLHDIGILIGGKVVSAELGMKLENVELTDLGQATRVVVDKDTTTIIGGGGDHLAIQARVNALRKQLLEANSTYDQENLQKRLGRLTGGIAVLRVGAVTESEMREKKGRVEDALHATRAAIEEGTVTGGGVALVRCIAALEKMQHSEEDALGVGIIKRALEEPMRQIARNAGREGGVMVDYVRGLKDKNVGFNAESGEFADLVAGGVIDPAKVVRLALQNAASIAGLMLMTETMIADLNPEPIERREHADRFGARTAHEG